MNDLPETLSEILRGMADMLDGPQSAGNLVAPAIIHRFREAADVIKRLEAENAALRERLAGLQKRFDRVNDFERSQCARPLEKLAERDKALACVTAERDAAIQTIFKYVRCPECKNYDDSSTPWWCLKHDRQAYPKDGCSTPEWRGLKEDAENE